MGSISPLILSFELSFLTVVILLLICTPLAWGLARTSSRLKPVYEAILTLPLILPPTVLGFYLLLLLNPQGYLGKFWLHITGQTLVFNFAGLLIGSTVYSLPFVLKPLQNAFEAVNKDLLHAASGLGATPLKQFFLIALPMARTGYFSAAVLGFAHTLGEFGVVLMIGGNIPGKTRTISIAIYDSVEQIQYYDAHSMAAILLILSFVMLLAVFFVNKKHDLI